MFTTLVKLSMQQSQPRILLLNGVDSCDVEEPSTGGTGGSFASILNRILISAYGRTYMCRRQVCRKGIRRLYATVQILAQKIQGLFCVTFMLVRVRVQPRLIVPGPFMNPGVFEDGQVEVARRCWCQSWQRSPRANHTWRRLQRVSVVVNLRSRQQSRQWLWQWGRQREAFRFIFPFRYGSLG